MQKISSLENFQICPFWTLNSLSKLIYTNLLLKRSQYVELRETTAVNLPRVRILGLERTAVPVTKDIQVMGRHVKVRKDFLLIFNRVYDAVQRHTGKKHTVV